MPNLDDPWDIYDSRLRAHKEWEEQRDFWRVVLSNPVGRREIWKLLDATHAFSTQFAQSNGGFPDPNATWFRAGEQAWGLALYHNLMRWAPEGVGAMMEEHSGIYDKPEIPPQPTSERPDIET